jgi:hypothetical protein
VRTGRSETMIYVLSLAAVVGLRTMKTLSKARNLFLAALVAAALGSCGDSKPTAAEFKRRCETKFGGDMSIMHTENTGDVGVCIVDSPVCISL